MKTYFFYSLLVVICLAIATDAAKTISDRSHSITFGAVGSREVHLKRDIVTEKFKRLRALSKDYEFRPKPGSMSYGRIITRIVITDQYTNGNGGKATLTAGGPGEMFAILHLKSQRGHGLSFIIDVFGQ